MQNLCKIQDVALLRHLTESTNVWYWQRSSLTSSMLCNFVPRDIYKSWIGQESWLLECLLILSHVWLMYQYTSPISGFNYYFSSYYRNNFSIQNKSVRWRLWRLWWISTGAAIAFLRDGSLCYNFKAPFSSSVNCLLVLCIPHMRC